MSGEENQTKPSTLAYVMALGKRPGHIEVSMGTMDTYRQSNKTKPTSSSPRAEPKEAGNTPQHCFYQVKFLLRKINFQPRSLKPGNYGREVPMLGN